MVSVGLTLWALLFTVSVAWIGEQVTSKQWQYLMSIPGHKWTWAVIFGIAGLIATIGLTTTAYRFIATGLIIEGFACLSICVFYIFAPLIGDSLITLGWLPWLLCSGIAFYFGAINQSAREW
jgi:hypothetical protein